ncbi:MAG: RnfABCDGE type electron transport complex subunit D [Planctomycetes bacterium]|nr:RnfABCDGE type electron transport complex subunit D [Planctomycetota bacterium]
MTPAASTLPSGPAHPRGFWAALKPQHMVSALVTLFLVLGQWRFQIIKSYPLTGIEFIDDYAVLIVSLSTAMATEALLSRWLRGEWPSVLSAYIAGNSVVILLKPQGGLWPFVLASAISIASKYVLMYRGRHLWNPTNFAISFMLLAAPNSITILGHEWGNELWTVGLIWTVGLLVVTRAKLLHITFTYLVCFCLLALLRCAITGAHPLTELAPVTGPMYQMLMFFMLTDPRTTVSSRSGRIRVVILIALLECVLRLANDFHMAWAAPFNTAPAIFALALIGPIALALDLRRKASA